MLHRSETRCAPANRSASPSGPAPRLLLRLLAVATTACATGDSGSIAQTTPSMGAASAGGGASGGAGGSGLDGGAGASAEHLLCDGVPLGDASGCLVDCYEPADTCFPQAADAGPLGEGICVLDGGPGPVVVCGGPDGGGSHHQCKSFDAGLVQIPVLPCLTVGDSRLGVSLAPFSGYGSVTVVTGPLQTTEGDAARCCYGELYWVNGRALPGMARAALVRTAGWTRRGEAHAQPLSPRRSTGSLRHGNGAVMDAPILGVIPQKRPRAAQRHAAASRSAVTKSSR